jgi:peptidoglycan hydrolase-like protein with peptidoglycan-binding domain
MFFASKTRWAGNAFMLLAWMLLAGFLQGAGTEEVAAAHQSENKKLQATLRNQGHYRGQIDGIFGLRTRASIRAYQKAENLPVTGELDAKTAAKLGLRPEVRERHGDGSTRGKPSAGIRRVRSPRPANKPSGKAVKTAAESGSGQVDQEKTLHAENDNRPR